MVQMWYKCAVFNNKQPQENHYKNKDKDSFNNEQVCENLGDKSLKERENT